jgi:hypothetical protein
MSYASYEGSVEPCGCASSFVCNTSDAAEIFATRPVVCSSSPTMTKYILVSGGVVSGIGKGVIGMSQYYPAQGTVVTD